MLAYAYLAIAVLFEVTFALSANAAQGFTRLWPSVLTIVAAAGGIFFLSLTLLSMDVGVGYTIWTGLGAVGTVVLGALLFGERITLPKVASFAVIITGVIGLRLVAA